MAKGGEVFVASGDDLVAVAEASSNTRTVTTLAKVEAYAFDDSFVYLYAAGGMFRAPLSGGPPERMYAPGFGGPGLIATSSDLYAPTSFTVVEYPKVPVSGDAGRVGTVIGPTSCNACGAVTGLAASADGSLVYYVDPNGVDSIDVKNGNRDVTFDDSLALPMGVARTGNTLVVIDLGDHDISQPTYPRARLVEYDLGTTPQTPTGKLLANAPYATRLALDDAYAYAIRVGSERCGHCVVPGVDEIDLTTGQLTPLVNYPITGIDILTGVAPDNEYVFYSLNGDKKIYRVHR
jgi:hypothetical protein